MGLLGCIALLSSTFTAPSSADPADDKRAEARRVAEQLDTLGQSVSMLAEEVDSGQITAADLSADVAAAERDVARAEAVAAGAKAGLAAEAVDTYVQGGVELGALGSAGPIETQVRMRQYAMTLQAKKADALDAARAQAAIVREKKGRLEAAREQAQQALADVEQARRDAAEVSARLEAAQGRIDGELSILVEQEQQERAAAEAEQVQRSLAARNPGSPVATLPAPARPSATAQPTVGVIVRPAPPPPGAAGPAPTTARPLLPPPKPAPDAGNEAPAPNPGAAAAVAEARRQIGKPYQWGGSGPNTFDCSGLTAWAWKAGGRILPHSSRMQFASLPKVNPADARPGDLFAFGSPIHHIGVYIGGGQMIAAPQTGKNVQYQPAYRKDLTGVVRP